MGCAFDIVLKGFVETACLGLLDKLYMLLTSIFLITLNIHTTPKVSMVTFRPPPWRCIWTNKGVVIGLMVCGDTEVYSAVQTKVSSTLSGIM